MTFTHISEHFTKYSPCVPPTPDLKPKLQYTVYLLLTFTSKYMEKYQKLPLLEDTLTNSFNNETFGIELKEDIQCMTCREQGT